MDELTAPATGLATATGTATGTPETKRPGAWEKRRRHRRSRKMASKIRQTCAHSYFKCELATLNGLRKCVNAPLSKTKHSMFQTQVAAWVFRWSAPKIPWRLKAHEP